MSKGEVGQKVGQKECSPAEFADAKSVPLPWSIKLMAISFALYLLMRGFQGFRWVIRWVTGG